LFGALYSIALIVSPQSFFGNSIKTSEEWQNPVIAKWWLADVRNMGVLALGGSIAGLFILLNGFKKGQKWAWWAGLSEPLGGVESRWP
jgi:hypothetical protein